jgi:Zn-dependent protease with chaperone function
MTGKERIFVSQLSTLPVPTFTSPPLAAPLLPKVDARNHICPGTMIRVALGTAGFVASILLTTLITYGIGLLFWVIGLIVYFTRLAKSRAALQGSAVRVGPTQFPEVYETAVTMSERLGLGEVPDVYVAHASQPNASAVRLGSRTFVLLFDDVLVGAARMNNPKVLDWILAHELAHHALGHTRFVRRAISGSFKGLSRRDEFSCDAVAHALIGDAAVARQALTLLMVGAHLYDRVDQAALAEQIREVVADKSSRKAEVAMRMTHPLLLRRMARITDSIKV